MDLLVGTQDGIEGVAALAGREVGPLAVADGVTWAIVDGSEVWSGNGTWDRVALFVGPRLTCLAPTAGGLLAGTAEAHLLRLDGGALELDDSFDTAEARDRWYTPWGGPADTRSIAAGGDTVLVNVHVGGVLRRGTADAAGAGASASTSAWTPLVDIDVDVHQVLLAGDGSILVATGAAGFGRSTDGGATWRFDDEGLHGSYCRAVAVAGDQVLLSASTGPSRTRGAVYRRPLGAGGPWERVSDLVPGNVDTHCLVASGTNAAFVTEGGSLWASEDAGATWSLAGKDHHGPRGLALA